MGIQKTTQCGMVVNAKAFEMLARQYSDPVKAIIQEIGANAADSHVRAGKEDMFLFLLNCRTPSTRTYGFVTMELACLRM